MKSALPNTWPIVFCALLLSTSAQADEFTVVPGHSLGRVWLNAPHATVRRIWGHPYMIQRQASYTVEFWRVNKANQDDYKAATFRNNRVTQLETNSPRFKTPHGISVNSSLGYIRRVLGKMSVVSLGLNDPEPDVAEHAAHYYDSVRRGLAFDIGLGFRPDIAADTTPHSICVHRCGRRFIFVNGTEIWAEDTPT